MSNMIEEEIITRATDILGWRDEAISWTTKPALALDQRCPRDLIETAVGVRLVKDHLVRWTTASIPYYGSETLGVVQSRY